jgi:hypothetical protein
MLCGGKAQWRTLTGNRLSYRPAICLAYADARAQFLRVQITSYYSSKRGIRHMPPNASNIVAIGKLLGRAAFIGVVAGHEYGSRNAIEQFGVASSPGLLHLVISCSDQD